MIKRIAATAVLALTVAGAIACGGGATPDNPPATGATVHPTRPAAATTKAPAKTPVSAEQEQANKAAADYLQGQSFSRKGLIEQLKYEGYPAKYATAAVDSLHADWNHQAALTAATYLRNQSFSRKGLISQLEFEGFTHEQAVYGVTKAGL